MENEILKLFSDGYSGLKIIQKLNLKPWYVYKVLYDNDIKLSKRKYTFTENYFETIDNHHKSYLLGLLFADGNNSMTKCTVRISLIEKDREILEYFRSQLNYTKELIYRVRTGINEQNTYNLEFYSKKLCNDLNSHGMIPNKTHFCKYPNIENKYDWSFICGYFDGDGHVSLNTNKDGYKKVAVSFCGNDKLILKIQEKITNELNIHSSITIRKKKKKNILTLNISGVENCLTLLTKMYSHNNSCLKRKYKKFIQIKKLYNLREKERINKINELNNRLIEKEKLITEKNNILNNISELIINEYNKNISIREISNTHKIDRRFIKKVLVNNNISIKSKEAYEEKRLENLKIYNQTRISTSDVSVLVP